jgi:predicted permease
VDVLVYLVIVAANVSIGLRLHLREVTKIKRLILGVLGIRHLLGPAVALGLLGLVNLSPWPVVGVPRDVALIQSSVSMGVMGAAAATMFNVHPRKASGVFVASSLFYLAVMVPLICWLFG